MSADTVRELVQAQIGQIAQAVERFALAERDYAREQQVLSQEEQRQAERLSHDMHCSAVMEAELFQLLKYCRLSGIDYEDIIRDGYAAGSLPCKDKKKGSGVLNSLEKNCYNGRFSHIYVEEAVWNHPRTQKFCPAFRRHR